jgi:hypothetical protein
MQDSTQGCYIIEQQKNVLLVDAQGPFNEVIAEKYHNDIKDVTEKMGGEPWGSLITLRGNNIFTPDTEQQLKKHDSISSTKRYGSHCCCYFK